MHVLKSRKALPSKHMRMSPGETAAKIKPIKDNQTAAAVDMSARDAAHHLVQKEPYSDSAVLRAFCFPTLDISMMVETCIEESHSGIPG